MNDIERRMEEKIKKNRKENEAKYPDFKNKVDVINASITKDNVLDKLNQIMDLGMDLFVSLKS